MRIRKVHVGQGKTTIEYDNPRGDQLDEVIFSTDDPPAPSFVDALQALASDIALICEIEEDEDHTIDVRQVSIKHTSDGFSAVLTGVRSIADGPGALTLNTPNRRSPVDGKEFEGTFSEETERRILKVIEEAERFIKGVRQNADLFAGQEVSV